MEVDIVDDARVGERKRHVGHAGELAVDQDLSRHIARHHEAVGVDAAVDLLDDVQVDLVVGVLHSLPPPPDAAQHALGEVAVEVALVAHSHACRHSPEDGGRHDHGLEHVGLSGHGNAVVHHLVHDLIDGDEVFLDALLAHFVEVIPEHVHHAVKKLRHQQRRHFSLHDCDEEHAVPLHMDDVVLGGHYDRLDLGRVRRLLHLIPEQLAASSADVASIVLLDDHFSRGRHDEDRVDHSSFSARACCSAGSCFSTQNFLREPNTENAEKP
mmetsp:Transcript_12975/g.29833  ORF Transcript_12975/g.29833 Transcript_12975/m.29833 type:complete len:269 (-) Transcript_12975:5-811(-)